MEQQVIETPVEAVKETTEEFSIMFDGINEGDSPTMASCTGCGNTYFFAIKLAL
ncbi:MAG: hypothetical protein PHQ03_05710 [Methylococcales bacterium]|nr:hypothetical protein [Methylococcales bacterium]